MNNRFLPGFLILLILSLSLSAQQPIFNQKENWNFGISSGASFGLNSNEASLFRGNGLFTSLSSDYFFGPLGLGINGGFINSKPSSSGINQFLTDRKFPLTSTITSTASQNAFLMLGPTLRLGQKAQLLASVKAGMFFNQSGGLIIGQQGAVRPLYRFDAGTKSLFPGFNGSLSFSYPVGTSSSFLLSTDFLQSSSSIQLFDPQQGIDIPVEQKRMFQTINAGISFVKTFNVKSPRDAASGQSSGRRSRQTGDGTATGNDNDLYRGVVKTKTKSNQSNDRIHGDPHVDEAISIIDPENKRVLKTKTKSNQSNDRTTNQNCGPVTTKTTHPDGTIEEQTFSCPDDAANYRLKIDSTMPNRISMNVTVPKQTQGATFGEKVNQGLHAAGSHLVSGKIVRNYTESGGSGIVTNRIKGGGGGGAAAASYAATGMVVNPGVQTNFFAREAGSGMASGKRSKDAGSGMATGRRQYQPLFSDGQAQGEVCNPCIAVVSNPLYQEKSSGENPLFENSPKTGELYCSGNTEGFDIYLIDRGTGASVAHTKTNHCGEYWFANVPNGNYSVQVMASFLSKKGYQYYKAASDLKTDVAGEVLLPDETWQHVLHNSNSPQMKAGISTSRSNIRNKSSITIVSGDENADGIADYYRAIATFSDGTSNTIADGKLSANASVITIPVEETNQQKTGVNTSRSNIKNISIVTGDNITVRGLFSDGTTKDITEYCSAKQQPGVMQITIAVADVDGDGMSDLIWSPRSNLGVNARTNNINVNELAAAIINTSRSTIKNLAVGTGDVDGDGVNELVVGSSLVGGTLPGGAVISAAMKPGNPIGGLTIKGGKNPGGDTARMRTNPLGEFEFSNLEPGNYTFTVEARYIISDETDLDLNDDDGDGVSSQNNSTLKTTVPKQTQGTTFGEKVNQGMIVAGNTKAQDHNSSRSNKTASTVAPNPNDSTVTAFNSLQSTLSELDTQLQNDGVSAKAGISTSRSNLRKVSSSITAITNDFENGNTAGAQLKIKTLNTLIIALQQSLAALGTAYTSISNVLKTKHDTAKNSVGNIR